MDKNTYMISYMPKGCGHMPRFEQIKVKKTDNLFKFVAGLLMMADDIQITPLSEFVGRKNDLGN